MQAAKAWGPLSLPPRQGQLEFTRRLPPSWLRRGQRSLTSALPWELSQQQRGQDNGTGPSEKAVCRPWLEVRLRKADEVRGEWTGTGGLLGQARPGARQGHHPDP